MDRQAMSEAEWQVMRVLWAKPGSCSKEVILALSEGFDWKDVTVKTLLGRLRKKDYISAEKKDGRFRYYPLVTEEEHLEHQLKNLLDNCCSGKQAYILERLVNLGNFSREKLERVEQQIIDKKNSAPEQMICSCIKGQCSCGHQKGETL